MRNSIARSAAALFLCAVLAAGMTSCTLFRKSSRTRVKTLLVTGNYLQSRLLAELAQYHSGQPIILFQQDPESDAPRLFYMVDKKSEEIAAAKFAEFVQFLNPKTVAFIGDENCVPADFVNQLRKGYRVMIIDSEDWDMNAQTLGDLLDQPKVAKEYRNFLSKYEENVPPPAVKR